MYFLCVQINQSERSSEHYACLPTIVTTQKKKEKKESEESLLYAKENASATAVKQVGFVRDAELSYTNLFFIVRASCASMSSALRE